MINQLIQQITKKSTLKDIDKTFLKRIIEKNLKDKKLKEFLESNPSKRSKKYKEFIKKIRRELNISYGMFQKKGKNLLETHSSTKERMPYYHAIYKNILKITKKPKSILDLGCGLNPLSYPYLKTTIYHAFDLNTKEVKNYFKKNNIKGMVKNLDLQIKKNIKKLPKADICFMFKFLDSLEKPKKYSEFLIKNIKAKFIIISFPLKTLKNKKMTTQKRGWLEQMLKRLNLKFKTFKTENEIFYIVKKIKKDIFS